MRTSCRAAVPVRRGACRVVLTALLLLGCANAAWGAVPTAERIESAIAETNVSSGRAQALRLELSLQIGDRPAVATGTLVSHPTGLARLELLGAGELVERHLLQGSELTVSRNGRLIDEYRIFLPPLFILQADSELTLRAALESFGVRPGVVGLADCGDADCFVLGDPRREVPRPEPPVMPVPDLEDMLPEDAELAPEAVEEGSSRVAESGGEESEVEVDVEDEDELSGEAEPEPEESEPPDDGSRVWPKLWIDTESYEVRGIDFASGVRVRLGPVAVFDKLRVPTWLSIEQPGKAPARLEVVRASRVDAAASAFTPAWLLSPPFTEDWPGRTHPEPAP